MDADAERRVRREAECRKAAARSPDAGTVREWRNNTLAAAADTAMRLTTADHVAEVFGARTAAAAMILT
jgi:hypothetical protein